MKRNMGAATQRKQYGPQVKAKAALAAIRGEQTANEIALAYGVHPLQVSKWKSQLVKGAPDIFVHGKAAKTEDERIDVLYRQIGQQKVEIDWLKKNLDSYDLQIRRNFVDSDHEGISLVRQCQLLGISRSGLYYEPAGPAPEDIMIMKCLDEQYTRTPFYGVRKMTAWLRALGLIINPKRVRRLLRLMGLEALYCKPKLSLPGIGHKIYPYLLKGVSIVRPNQVWSTDITYIRLAQGFVYLVAIMDWFSRYVLSWSLSVTLSTDFCLEALDRALACGRPDIFNSDQGSQFTSAEFTGLLETARVKISMDGRGRFLDNIFVERLWRSVKYEEVYLKDYADVPEARESLNRYFQFYNTERFHEALAYKTPEAVYARA